MVCSPPSRLYRPIREAISLSAPPILRPCSADTHHPPRPINSVKRNSSNSFSRDMLALVCPTLFPFPPPLFPLPSIPRPSTPPPLLSPPSPFPPLSTSLILHPTGHADTSRHEWTSQIHRDTYASYIGHPPLLAYIALGMGESRERVRAMMVEKMVQPVGPPPVVED